MDILDPSQGIANEYAAPGGLTSDEVEAALAMIGRRLPIAAAALAAYDPRSDPKGSVARIGLGFLRVLAADVASP
jgi:arginase family enzyme